MDNSNQLSLEETLERMRALLTGVEPALYPHIVRLVETHIQLVKATKSLYGDTEHEKRGPG